MLFLTASRSIVTMIVPLTIAKLIFSLSSERASYFYRVLFLIPIVVPGRRGLSDLEGDDLRRRGLVNRFLRRSAVPTLDARLAFSPAHGACGRSRFVGFPFAGGIQILIYYAGLTSIPESVHEAAVLDGASGMRKFFTDRRADGDQPDQAAGDADDHRRRAGL